MATATKTKPVVKDIENRAFHEAHAITIRSAEKRSREAIIEAVTARWEVGEELDRVYGIPTRVESEASRTHETGMVSESEVVSGILQSYVLQEWSFNTGPGVGWVQVLKSAGREE